MGKFNLLSMTFAFLLVHVASSPMLQKNSRPKGCLRGLKYYCTNANLRDSCQVDGECEPYAVSGPCADPDVYCLKQDTALACDRTDFCVTWPQPGVTAVHNEEPKGFNIGNYILTAFALATNGLSRVYDQR